MNGGGGLDGIGGGGDNSSNGMITLEDLESFSEDQLSDSGTGSLEEAGETIEDEEQQDGLLRYWQDAARGHQVEVPRGKAFGIKRTHTHCTFQIEKVIRVLNGQFACDFV